MQLKSLRLARVDLYTTGLKGDDQLATGVNLIASVDDAIAASVARTGDPAVAVIPDGPYVIPYYQAA
jgi:hypothetical protein